MQLTLTFLPLSLSLSLFLSKDYKLIARRINSRAHV